MDFDPKIASDGHGWCCNFHLGYGYDVVLEDAIKEKSCVQVLRCLIAKADAEIHELEDELAILQCQLKWAESDKHGNPYEVCCATFKQKINYLTKSMKNLRNKRISNEHDMDTTLKIQRPAERIYDIINTLTKQKVSEPEEQVEDSFNEMNSLVNAGSVDIFRDLKQKETTLESSADIMELTTDFERQCKPLDTVSEESCSDVTRYALKDSFEARVLGKIDVQVTKKDEVDYECTPEERNAFTTCLQEYSNKGNSKSNALQHEEIEDCLSGSKNSGSGSSPLSAKTKNIVKVEVDDSDVSTRNVAADSLHMTQDQESRSLVEGQQEVKENHSPSTDDVEIVCGRNRNNSGLSAITKSQVQTVQKKNFSGPKHSNVMMLKPQGKIRKRRFSASSNNLKQPKLPSSEVDVRFCTLPETILQRKSVGTTMSEEVNISQEDDLYARDNPASKSDNELVVCLESPLSGEGKALPLDSSPTNPCNVSSRSTNLDILATKESQADDLASLRLMISQQPNFLHKMKVPELRLIAKRNDLKGVSKLKKEKMIEELTKLLNATFRD